jgi:CheY-like chemotaxis protein
MRISVMGNLPIFYYPSTVAWLDDDETIICAIKELFEKNKLITFTKPLDCLNYFNKYESPLKKTTFLKGLIGDDYYETVNHSPVDLNVPDLHKIHSYPERHKEITVLLVDYNMPEINGIELCKQLKSQPVKKILLTGQASLQEAVSAFNENLIDRFIRKDSLTLAQDILNYVDELEKEYFRENTRGMLDHLETENRLPLSDPAYIKFFNEICADQNIKEYLLMDKHGSMILIDGNNRRINLVIHTDRTLDSFTHQYTDEPEVSIIMEIIKERKVIPFFGIGKESWEFETRDWTQYLYKPKTFIGREKYYYAFVTE